MKLLGYSYEEQFYSKKKKSSVRQA